MNLVTLSSKGQLVIPRAVREAAHLSLGDQLAVDYVDGEIRLRPLTSGANHSLEAAAGCLANPRRKKLSAAAEREAIKAKAKARNAA